MARYIIDGQNYDLPSRSTLIDTNLLVAYFDDRESAHDEALQFFAMLDADHYFLVIPMSVLVETWGMLAGRKRSHSNGLKLLDWISQPGSVAVVPDSPGELPRVSELVATYELDVVDAMLLRLAHDIQVKCRMPKPFPIASMDRRDFYRIAGQLDVMMSIFNIKTLDIEEFGVPNRRRSPPTGRSRRSAR